METSTIVPLDSQTTAILSMDENGLTDLVITHLRDNGEWRRIYISGASLDILIGLLGAAEKYAEQGLLLSGEVRFFGRDPKNMRERASGVLELPF